MKKRLVLIKHESASHGDRASAHLAERGFEIDWRRPYAGDSLDDLKNGGAEDLAGTILYGGPQNAPDSHIHPYLADEARWVEACIERGVPTLGICLGGQILAHTLGAEVGPHKDGIHEFGYYPVHPTEAGRTDFLPEELTVVQAHFHEFQLPAGAELLATSELFERQAFRYGDSAYAVQFHPEVTIPGMRRWQEAEWAPWGEPGAQSREEQDRLGARHDARQHAWFTNFLDGLFGRPHSE
ncbi:MAG: glutamine amidotransferase [Rhodovibrionaceae bacterium]|nr:glutamine amidotransferase [Rhodovibrionaceae bacterium]